MKLKSDLYYDTNITRYKNSSLSIPIFFRQLGSKAPRDFFSHFFCFSGNFEKFKRIELVQTCLHKKRACSKELQHGPQRTSTKDSHQ